MANTQKIRRQHLTREAEGYLELGLAQQALDALVRLEQIGPLAAHAAYLRGEALRSLERNEEGQVWLQQAADEMPENIHVWIALAWCRKRTGRLDLAIDALENALLVEPGEAILHYNLACYWCLARNKSQALNYLSQALEIDGNYRDLIHNESDFDALRNDADFQAIAGVIV